MCVVDETRATAYYDKLCKNVIVSMEITRDFDWEKIGEENFE